MRQTNPQVVNAVYGLGDTSPLVLDPRNIVLMDGNNIGLFAWRGPGIFEGHIHFEARGRKAIGIGKTMLKTMFSDYEAKMIWGLTPWHLRHVRLFNRKLGFESRGQMSAPEGEHELFVMEV